MPRGYKLTIFGLICGLLIGFAILELKHYIADQLTELLDDEARASCNCRFEADSIDVSLLLLQANAKNPRLVENGKPRMIFKKLRGYFSLSKVQEHKILLTELQLKEGMLVGVAPSDAPYRFINHLAAPVPPERERPGRWKLKLMRLVMSDTSFVHPLTPAGASAARTLRGTGLHLDVVRDDHNEFKMTPHLEALYLVDEDPRKVSPAWLGFSALSPHPKSIGTIDGAIYAHDDRVSLLNMRFDAKESNITVDGDIAQQGNNPLNLKVSYLLDSHTLNLADVLTLALKGEAKIAGNLNIPEIQGTTMLASTKAAAVRIDTNATLPIEQFNSEWSLSLTPQPILKVTKLLLASNGVNFELPEPAFIDQNSIRAQGKLQFNNFSWANAQIAQGLLNLSASGPFTSPQIALKGKIGTAKIDSFNMEELSVEALFKDNLLGVTLSLPESATQKLEAHGDIAFASATAPLIKDLVFSASKTISDSGVIASLTGTLNGPLHLNQLVSNAALTIQQQGNEGTRKLLDGSLALKDGKVQVELSGLEQAIKGRGRIELLGKELSEIIVDLEPSPLSDILGLGTCLEVRAQSTYRFSIESPTTGEGSLNLKDLSIGCAPYRYSVLPSAAFLLRDGTLTIPELSFVDDTSKVQVNGAISLNKGISLNASGSLELASLAPLVPGLDDLRGVATLKASVSGSFANPAIDAKLVLSNGEVSAEAAQIAATSINGAVVYANGALRVESLQGLLNQGTFAVSGAYDIRNPKNSTLQLKLDHVAFEPEDQTTLTFSSDLTLGDSESGLPLIRGKVTLDNGEFQRNLDLRSLLRFLSSYLFSKSSTKTNSRSLPEIELDVRVLATRNLFILTNWLGAELMADLQIAGTLANPSINGKMETISGWFGLKDRRFDITTGEITFRPTLSEPELTLSSEAYVRSYLGEELQVTLDASGPLSAPRIRLSSDRGLSEREIISMLTSGENQSLAAVARGLRNQNEFRNNRNEDRNISWLGRIFKSLTTIDSLSLEPSFNVKTGLVEPSVVATKRIANSLSLVGQSGLGGSTSSSKVSLVYGVTPRFTIAANAETASVDQRTTFGIDTSYAILSNRKKFVRVHVRGNDSFSDEEILEAVRLNERSRVLVRDVDRIADSITDFYGNQGWRAARVSAICQAQDDDLCTEIEFRVLEGKSSKIVAIEVQGENLPSFIHNKEFTEVPSNTIASRRFLTDYQNTLIRALRSEGYIGTRVETSLMSGTTDTKKTLAVLVSAGRPVSFEFRGNHQFTAEDFLATINLFERKQPFGSNTINILLRNIERLYRQAGYLYATVQYHRDEESEPGRTQFIIDIQEEGFVAVSRVSVDGNTELSRPEIEALLSNRDVSLAKEVLAPQVAFAEQLSLNADVITSIYQEHGFSTAKVSYRLIPDEQGNSVEVQYVIDEGYTSLVREIKVNYQKNEEIRDITLPSLPSSPLSTVKINTFIDEISARLQEHGFLTPTITSTIEHEHEVFVVDVDPGPVTTIKEISVLGASAAQEFAVRKILGITSGERWDANVLDQAKRRLFKLRLFSKIEFGPADGLLDHSEEVLLIKLTERPGHSVEIGAGFNSTYGTHLFGEAEESSIFADGRALIFRLDTYYDSASADISEGVASLRYSDPFFLWSDYAFNQDLRYQKVSLATLEFDYNRFSLASYLYRTWDNGFTTTFGHTILQDNLDHVSPDSILSRLDSGIVNVSFLSGSINFDRRDEPLNPISGYNLGVEYTAALRELGSDANFYSLGISESYLHPLPGLFDQFSIAFANHTASAWTFGASSEVPITQRYYAGGRTTIRGFKENSLGPRGDQGSVLGGDVLFINNIELRYRLAEKVSLYSFFDVGSVYLRSRETSSDELRKSTGIGLNYLSPIGPVGFDIGHPLDRRDGESSVRLDFNIGTIF